MPEELNRRVIGVLADLHCAPTEQAVRNLRAEDASASTIHQTGNTIVEATNETALDDIAARSGHSARLTVSSTVNSIDWAVPGHAQAD